MKLKNTVTIDRPTSCGECPFSAIDADEGKLCCGFLRDKYMYRENGEIRFKRVESPGEALKHDCFCMFVGGRPE